VKKNTTVALLASIVLVMVILISPKLVHRWRRWRIEHASISMPGPRFVVPDIFGVPVDLSKRDDKVILLQLWATWCPYCRADVPALIRLQERYPHGLEIVGFSVDQDPDLVREFYRRYQLNYQVAMVDPEVERFFAAALGIPEGNVSNGTPVPTSIVIGRDGRIRSIYLGRDIRTFDHALVQLLESAPNTQALRRPEAEGVR
jgi:thiol-disulfide isomerase/thioredoxin